MIKSQNKPRILIVEDERLPAEDLSIRLQKNDFEVVGVAGSGATALKLTNETQPDLVLMDIKIKGEIDGIETAKLIHEKYAVPVIFATAYGDDSYVARAIQDADAYGFLHKPIDSQAATTMIKIALTRFATDQMMLRINELLGMKDKINTGLQSVRDVGEIGRLLFDAFADTHIFSKYWIVLWSDDNEIAASESKGISQKNFATYLKKLDNVALADSKMMVPDEIMTAILKEDCFMITIRSNEKIIGVFAFTWNLGIPNFRSEFAVIKDVAHLISQSIENTTLKREQEKSQKQVADSKAHIQAILEQSTTGIYIIDQDSKFVYVNDRLCEIFDRSRQELMGSNFSEHLGPSRLKITQEIDATKVGQEAPGEYSLDILRPSGEMRDILVSAKSFVDSEGNIKNVGHALDVTEHNIANMELKKLSQAVEQSPVMTLITDVEGTIQYVNQQFISVMGYSHDELIGNNPRIFKSDTHNNKFYKTLWNTINKGSVWSGEVVNKKKNGDLTWGRTSISPIRNSYGIVTHFVGITEDISRDKKEEAKALKDQKLRDVLYSITSAAIQSKDVSVLYDKIYTYVSEIISSSNFFLALLNKAEKSIYFPYERDIHDPEMPESIPFDPKISLTARTISQGKTLHVHDKQIRKLIDTGQVIISGELPSVWLGIPLKVKDEVIGALVLQEYDGLTRYDDEAIKLLELAAGQVAITIDRARKASALEELANELANANGMKELLLDVITHDLRNPAGVISSITQMLRDEDDTNEMFEVLEGSSQSLMKVIENATVLSKLSLGESISLDALDLVQVVTEMKSEFSSQLESVSMKLNIFAPESCIIQANPIISEIPKNYISNAIKYSSEGGTIDLIIEEQDGRPTLKVEDQGKLIPEDLRSTIFLRNVQLAEGKKRGRGLGLAIVKRIALAHDAKVGVTASSNGGNSFYLKF